MVLGAGVVQMAGDRSEEEEEVRSEEYSDVGVFAVELDKDRNKSANISSPVEQNKQSFVCVRV